MPPSLPALDASLGHTPQGRREVGGLIAIRGFYYQWLYSLRLMPRILDGTYDAYRCEDVDDYLAWAVDESPRITKLGVVQVKHRNDDDCLLRDAALVRSVLEGFTLLCDGRLARCTGAEIDFRLVYNPVHDCRALGCVSAVKRLREYSRLRRRMRALGASRSSTFACEPFLCALKSAIEDTFESFYRSRYDQVDGANEFRDEMLQRSQLLPTRGRVANADVRTMTTRSLVLYHRCYLYPTESAQGQEWKVFVRRYPSGSEQMAYTIPQGPVQ